MRKPETGSKIFLKVGIAGLFGVSVLMRFDGFMSGATIVSESQAASMKELKNRYVFIPQNLDKIFTEPKKKQKGLIKDLQNRFTDALKKNLGAAAFRKKIGIGSCTGEVVFVDPSASERRIADQSAGQTGYKRGNDIATSIQESGFCGRYTEICRMNKRLVSRDPPTTPPAEPVRVAILDTGIDKEALNGLIFEKQHTFISRPGVPIPTDGHVGPPVDDNGHGTHMAGIIASVAGGRPDVVQLMALKTHDKNGVGTFYDNIQAIDYAARNSARVINASWGNYVGRRGESQEAKDAMENCLRYHNSVLVVAAAGNYANDNDKIPFYPASLPLPTVLSVNGATWDVGIGGGKSCTLWSGTNYGSRRVDVAAPGTLINSTYPKAIVPKGQCLLSGSSVSAAIITGEVTLRIASAPGAPLSTIISGIPTVTVPQARNRRGGRIRSQGSPTGWSCDPRSAPPTPRMFELSRNTCRALGN